MCRKPGIVADAARIIFDRDARQCTGHFFIDEEVLASEGVTDLAEHSTAR
jgi:citronellol/citronellal dehydrogenase